MSTRVSVVITAYNFSRFIRTTIASVQQQTLRDIEIIVVDDCSSDSTYEIVVEAAAGDERIRPFRTDVNSGTCAARNVGIEAARGRWIATLDGDDAYHPERLATLMAIAERRGADVIADNTMFCHHETWQSHRFLFEPDLFSHEDWLSIEEFTKRSQPDRSSDLSWLKPMMRKAFLDEHQIRYAHGLTRGEDFLILFSCLVAGAKFALVPDAYYLARDRPGSVSRPIKPKPGYWDGLIDCNRKAREVFESCDNAEVWALLKRHERAIAAIVRMGALKKAVASRDYAGIVGSGLRLVSSPMAWATYPRAMSRRLLGRGRRVAPVLDPTMLGVLRNLRDRDGRPASETWSDEGRPSSATRSGSSAADLALHEDTTVR